MWWICLWTARLSARYWWEYMRHYRQRPIRWDDLLMAVHHKLEFNVTTSMIVVTVKQWVFAVSDTPLLKHNPHVLHVTSCMSTLKCSYWRKTFSYIISPVKTRLFFFTVCNLKVFCFINGKKQWAQLYLDPDWQLSLFHCHYPSDGIMPTHLVSAPQMKAIKCCF